MYFRCVFLLLAVAVVRSAFPQNIRRITHRDGLSNSSILSLAQDADGYIWAGSCDGLNLWDGNSARHFRLSGNLIQEIVATDDGYLWVRTNYGVDRFDTRDRRIEMLAGFQRVYKFAARSRDEAFFLHGNKLYGYVASQGAFEPVDVRGAELNGVLRMCLDGDGVLWLVRSEDIRCAQVVYDAGGRASVGEWERMPLPDGVVFTRYDGDRTIFFTDRNGMLFRFDTGQRRAFPIFDLREELGRRGTLSSVISDKDDYVLAFGMSGVLRLRSTDPIEGRYELQEIDVNCGVFALLKDCNQDIVWIGTDGSGLLRQAVGEVAIRSVTYETLPYLLTKPIKALHVDPDGASGSGPRTTASCASAISTPGGPLRGRIPTAIRPPIRRWGKIRSIRLPEAAAMCCGSAATAACATTRTGTGGFSNCRGAGRCDAYTGFTRTGTGCCGLRAWATGSGASNCPGAPTRPSPRMSNRWSWDSRRGAGTSFSPFARSPIPPSGSATTVSASYTMTGAPGRAGPSGSTPAGGWP